MRVSEPARLEVTPPHCGPSAFPDPRTQPGRTPDYIHFLSHRVKAGYTLTAVVTSVRAHRALPPERRPQPWASHSKHCSRMGSWYVPCLKTIEPQNMTHADHCIARSTPPKPNRVCILLRHLLRVLQQMFGISGGALSKIRHMQNGGKRPRHSIDAWDKQSTLHAEPS